MKVSAILKGRKDEYGRRNVQIRVNEGNKRTFKTTQIKLTDDQFKNGVVVGHPEAKKFNLIIKNLIHQVEGQHIAGVTNQYPDADFRTYTERLLRIWDKEKKGSTLNVYNTEMEKFLAFAGEIKLSRITPALLEDYKAFLLKQGYDGKPYDSNTVWKSFKNIRTIVGHAKKNKVIENNPFDVFTKPSFKEKPRQYLLDEELKAIDDYLVSPECPKQFFHCGTWFLIGCYTGLRYSDMQQFRKSEHIKNGRLSLETVKTGDIVGLPVRGKVQELFERIDYAPLNLSNQGFNDYLKEIMKAADVKTWLTVHLSRHTFAMRCANAGVSQEVTARLMAVKSLKTVSTYYKVVNKRIDKEIDGLL